MKKKFKWLSILCVAVVGVISGCIITSHASDETNTYSQSSFTEEWSAHCIRENTADRVGMNLVGKSFVPNSNTVAAGISENMVSVYPQYDTVLRFRAPYRGVVRIHSAAGVTCREDSADGMGFHVLVQDHVTGDKSVKVTTKLGAGATYQLDVTEVSVKAGDFVEFVYTDSGTGNNANDVMLGTVCVTYTEIQEVAIQVEDRENGQISASSLSGLGGDEILVDIAPNAGYHLAATGLQITYVDGKGLSHQITPKRVGFQSEERSATQYAFVIPQDADEEIMISGDFVSTSMTSVARYSSCDFSENSDVIQVAFRFYGSERAVKSYGCILGKTSNGDPTATNQESLIQKGKRVASQVVFDRTSEYIDYSYKIVGATSQEYIVVMPYVVYSDGAEKYGEITYLNLQNQTAYTGARTFYVSSTDGDDSNDGLSASTPWKTVSKATTMAYNPGDTILFKKGDTWYLSEESDTTIHWYNLCGTNENVITLGAYGEGNNPAIYRSTSVIGGEDSRCIVFQNAEHLRIRNLDFGYANQGITFFYSNNYAMSDVEVSGCNFRNIYGTVQADGLSLPFSSAILVDGDRQLEGRLYDAVLFNLSITDCHCDDAGALYGSATEGQKASGISGIVLNNLIIEQCTTTKNGYYGTTVCGVDGGKIIDSKFDGSGARHNAAGQAGIMLACMNYEISNTDIINTVSPNGVDGCGIDFEQSCRNVLVDTCNISNNAGSGIMFYDSRISTGGNFDCKVKNCTFNNNSIGNSNNPDCHIFVVWSSARGYCLKTGEISNNTYSNDVTSFIRCRKTLFEEAISTLENVTIENNQTIQ